MIMRDPSIMTEIPCRMRTWPTLLLYHRVPFSLSRERVRKICSIYRTLWKVLAYIPNPDTNVTMSLDIRENSIYPRSPSNNKINKMSHKLFYLALGTHRFAPFSLSTLLSNYVRKAPNQLFSLTLFFIFICKR